MIAADWSVMGRRVLVDPDPKEEMVGGVIIPATATEDAVIGQVLAIGEEVKSAEVGNRVIYSKYGGVEVSVDGVKLLVLNEVDILLIKR